MPESLAAPLLPDAPGAILVVNDDEHRRERLERLQQQLNSDANSSIRFSTFAFPFAVMATLSFGSLVPHESLDSSNAGNQPEDQSILSKTLFLTAGLASALLTLTSCHAPNALNTTGIRRAGQAIMLACAVYILAKEEYDVMPILGAISAVTAAVLAGIDTPCVGCSRPQP